MRDYDKPKQFSLRALFALTTVLAVLIIPAKFLFASPVFRLIFFAYLSVFGVYVVIRAPFIYWRLSQLREQRRRIQQQRLDAVSEARRRMASGGTPEAPTPPDS